MDQRTGGHELKRLYRIKGDAFRGFITGQGGDGSQFLIVLQQPRFVVVQFDASGELLRNHPTSMQTVPDSKTDVFALEDAFGNMNDPALLSFLTSVGFVEGPIVTKRFFLDNHRIGVVDFPRVYSECLASPSDYSPDEVAIAKAEFERWRHQSPYELWLNAGTNLWMKRSGEIESS